MPPSAAPSARQARSVAAGSASAVLSSTFSRSPTLAVMLTLPTLVSEAERASREADPETGVAGPLPE